MKYPWIALGLAVAVVFEPTVSSAKNRFALEPEHVEATTAYVYARMTDEACLRELDRRKLPYERVEETKQIDLPIRFTGPIRGVEYTLTYRERKDDKTSPAAIADCRLALAIDDFSQTLAAHDIVKVEYLSMYRRRGVGFVKPGKRHPSGRAIDIATLERKDGKVFSVIQDWQGRVGQKTCGEGAATPRKDTEGARLLRDIVCEADEQKSFNLILTPHYDWGHRDHFHLEVRSDIRWYLTQ